MSKFFSSLSFFLIAIFIFLASCRTSRKVTGEKKPITDNKSAKVLSEDLKRNQFKYNWISAKFSAEVDIDSNKTSFNVSMRGRKDSVLWMSISPALGIEVARAIITRDSVKFIDRIHSVYFKGDYNYISKLLNAELDFDILQSLLVGNSVDFYDEEDKLRTFIKDNNYVLSTIRKKTLRKVINRNKELRDPLQTIWLEPETFKITRILFKDFNTDRTFDADFSKFNKVDTLLFPYMINCHIKAEKMVDFSIDYSKVSINSVQEFPFNIPNKYERIEYK
jgi:hypothetical protein